VGLDARHEVNNTRGNDSKNTKLLYIVIAIQGPPITTKFEMNVPFTCTLFKQTCHVSLSSKQAKLKSNKLVLNLKGPKVLS
jgi:hypothetical protein